MLRYSRQHPTPKELIIHSPSSILPTHNPVLKRTPNWVLPVKSREILSTATGPRVGAPAASAAATAAPSSHRIWRAHACSMSRGARRFEVGPAAPFLGFSCGIHAAATALLSLPPPERPQFTTAWAMSAPASAGSGLGPGIWQLERIIDGRPHMWRAH